MHRITIGTTEQLARVGVERERPERDRS